jgi:hypothetical protein
VIAVPATASPYDMAVRGPAMAPPRGRIGKRNGRSLLGQAEPQADHGHLLIGLGVPAFVSQREHAGEGPLGMGLAMGDPSRPALSSMETRGSAGERLARADPG